MLIPKMLKRPALRNFLSQGIDVLERLIHVLGFELDLFGIKKRLVICN